MMLITTLINSNDENIQSNIHQITQQKEPHQILLLLYNHINNYINIQVYIWILEKGVIMQLATKEPTGHQLAIDNEYNSMYHVELEERKYMSSFWNKYNKVAKERERRIHAIIQ